MGIRKKNILYALLLLALPFNRIAAQQDCGMAKDSEGNLYRTVMLGKQCWMRENLRTTHTPDGTEMKAFTHNFGTERFPGGNPANVLQYGLLYTWNEALNGARATENVPSGVQGICPDGWHLPSNFEWMALEDFLGYRDEYRCGTDVNNVAKALASREGWVSGQSELHTPCSIADAPENNDASGFCALPSGCYWNGHDGFGTNTGFWTASEGSDVTSPIHFFSAANATVEINCTPKEAAYPIRCLKDPN